MNQSERVHYLINKLKNEDDRYKELEVPDSYLEQTRLLRSLMNVRRPTEINEEFLKVQDEYLSNLVNEKGTVIIDEIQTLKDEYPYLSLTFKDKISIWQGDITRLKIDAIVNAANSQMLGCFAPCHGCIDNAIHSIAGVQLRDECNEIMEQQGHEEETGKAKITKAYNLPCKHVIHTVGPIVRHELTTVLEEDLRSCYRSCLECAVKNEVRTIAFCCISTGEFHFPNERAAEIAIETVIEFLNKNESKIDRVIFNVFKDLDNEIYRKLVNIYQLI
ncbi:MAG: macro domain protein [Clostridiaceae bacterium]|jgi:O-acetyl-ADP-ribose deacetylase (regulator of RNase III)|nr:macro domain protein [Clostridiaceae bacterium]